MDKEIEKKQKDEPITRHIGKQPVPKKEDRHYIRSDFPPPKQDNDKGKEK